MMAKTGAENERLRERLGPRGLEVVEINGAGHYVNKKVKAEIERLRAELDLECRRLQTSEDLRTGLSDALNKEHAEIERLHVALRSISQLLSYGVNNTARHKDAKQIADAAIE